MTHVSDAQLLILYKGFVEAKDFLMNSNMPDANKQPLMMGVNQALGIIRNANQDTGKPTGGSRGYYYSYDPVEASKNLILMGGGECAKTKKTKALFEMFHLK